MPLDRLVRMSDTPTTRYVAAPSGGHIAYQVVGKGPDLVPLMGWWGQVEDQWEMPPQRRFLERLMSFRRLLLFDKQGTGLSDPVTLNDLPTLEGWMDDVSVVMSAAESEQVTLLANAAGGLMAILFAATYPRRTAALILVDCYARALRAEDYPAGFPAEVLRVYQEGRLKMWGTGEVAELLAPSLSEDASVREWMGRVQRHSAGPGAVAAMQTMIDGVDLRGILPLISVPTLVVHRQGDGFIRVGHGRYLAQHIPNARYVELPGDDHLVWAGDQDAVLDEIEEFLTGARSVPDADRVLATVMFTDIVGSTERAASLGDRRWRELLDAHDTLVRRQLDRYRGREVQTTGDGFLATFDGPARGIRCARSIVDAVRPLGIEVRAGLHAGECELRGQNIGGLAVHIAARVASLAGSCEVLTSSTVKDLVAGSGIEFEDRGEHDLKGVPGTWKLYAVQD
jgi:class 3 adenylate cyclase